MSGYIFTFFSFICDFLELNYGIELRLYSLPISRFFMIYEEIYVHLQRNSYIL